MAKIITSPVAGNCTTAGCACGGKGPASVANASAKQAAPKANGIPPAASPTLKATPTANGVPPAAATPAYVPCTAAGCDCKGLGVVLAAAAGCLPAAAPNAVAATFVQQGGGGGGAGCGAVEEELDALIADLQAGGIVPAYTASKGVQLVGRDFESNLLPGGGIVKDGNQLTTTWTNAQVIGAGSPSALPNDGGLLVCRVIQTGTGQVVNLPIPAAGAASPSILFVVVGSTAPTNTSIITPAVGGPPCVLPALGSQGEWVLYEFFAGNWNIVQCSAGAQPQITGISLRAGKALMPGTPLMATGVLNPDFDFLPVAPTGMGQTCTLAAPTDVLVTQKKTIFCSGASGGGTMRITPIALVGYTTITMHTIGDFCDLLWVAGSATYLVVGYGGATVLA